MIKKSGKRTMNDKLDKELQDIFDKAMEPTIFIIKEVVKITNNQRQELIEEFMKEWDDLRDFVLDAPILSDDVYVLRDYIHKIKDYIKLKKERKK